MGRPDKITEKPKHLIKLSFFQPSYTPINHPRSSTAPRIYDKVNPEDNVNCERFRFSQSLSSSLLELES